MPEPIPTDEHRFRNPVLFSTPECWACVGESGAFYTVAALEAEQSRPVYDLSFSGHSINMLIARIDETIAALKAIPQQNIRIWLSVGALGPRLVTDQTLRDIIGLENASSPPVTGYAVRTYIDKIHDEVRTKKLTWWIATHWDNLDDSALFNYLTIRTEREFLFNFRSMDGLYPLPDFLHLNAAGYQKRVRVALGLDPLP